MNASLARMCATCATEFPADQPLPVVCPICSDDRQYVPPGGQRWISYEELAAGHSLKVGEVREGLYTLKVDPGFGIDPRALLVCSPGGNVLWDCIPLIDGPTVEFIASLGGLKAIAISHPHFYSVMRRWAEAFDCPIYIHEFERPWVFNGGGRVEYWQGDDRELWDGLSIVRIGGHFPGSSVMRVPGRADRVAAQPALSDPAILQSALSQPALSEHGALLTGDTLYLSRSMRHLSMMHSYPNLIPLPTQELQQVVDRVLALEFDTIYGAFPWQDLEGNAWEVFLSSVARYDCLRK